MTNKLTLLVVHTPGFCRVMKNFRPAESYLTRSWECREQRFMRLANHRPSEDSKVLSDYVTVQIDASLDFYPWQVNAYRQAIIPLFVDLAHFGR